MAWSNTAAQSMNALVEKLLSFIDQKRYELKFDWRKRYLERYLNEQFDPTSKRIVLINARFLPKRWHFQESENKPIYHFNDYDPATAYAADDYVSLIEHDPITGYVYYDIYKAKVPSTGYNPRANSGKWQNLTAIGELSRQWQFNNEDYTEDTRFWVLLPTSMPITSTLTYKLQKAIAKYAVHGINYRIGYATEYLLDKQFL